MQENKNRAVAIIGYGTAGVNAAIALRRNGYDGKVLMFSDIDSRPYSPILTSYYAGGEKSFEECFPWTEDELGELELDVHAAEPVIALDPAAHTLTTTQGDYSYDKCVIATGSTPTTVGFPRDCGYEPLVLRSLDDAERLKAAFDDLSCHDILVSGASMVALKTVESCLRRGKNVTLVGMNEHVLDFNALPAAAERFERGLAAKGVQLRLGQTIASVRVIETNEVDADRATRLEVTFSNGDTQQFDEISVAHGMKSNLDFVRPSSLAGDRALTVDDFMRTSDPDVYAAGDVAAATELVSGEKRVVGIWKNAALQGACAGAAIAAELAGRAPSEDIALRGSISTNTIAVDGTLFISAGTIELNDARSVEVREDDDMTVVYIFQNEGEKGEGESGRARSGRRLVGFNITCDRDEPGSKAYDIGAMLTMRIERGCLGI